MDHKQADFTGNNESTTTHEIGHFLGLGHEFSEDEEGEAKYLSIMGYSKGVDYVTERDFEAVRGIYDGPLSLREER